MPQLARERTAYSWAAQPQARPPASRPAGRWQRPGATTRVVAPVRPSTRCRPGGRSPGSSAGSGRSWPDSSTRVAGSPSGGRHVAGWPVRVTTTGGQAAAAGAGPIASSTASRVASGTSWRRPVASVKVVAIPRASAARRSSSSIMSGGYGTLTPTMSLPTSR